MSDNIVSTPNMKQLDNLMLRFVFESMTIKNGLKNFQLITSPEQLNCSGSLIPQNIFNAAPEQTIISIDTVASNEWPVGGTAGHLFAITGNMPLKTEVRATPILCVWAPLSGTSDLYVALYNGNGDLFKWRKISENYSTERTLTNSGGDITFVYRVISGRFVEWKIDTGNVAYPTQTDVITLPFSPLLNTIEEPLALWADNGEPTGENAVRFTGNSIQIICADKWLHGHGVFSIA